MEITTPSSSFFKTTSINNTTTTRFSPLETLNFHPIISTTTSYSSSLSSFTSPISVSRSRNFSPRIVAYNSISARDDQTSSSQELALLLEVEGVLMDVHRLGNRQSFNLAFKKLGLDCANWSEPIYLDLVRKTGGDEDKMLTLFFNRIGWPTSLPTSEKETFMKSVLREKRNALDEFVMSPDLPLRPGVENFIDDALSGGIPVVILTAYSKNGDKLARAIVEKLGSDRVPKIKIVGKEETDGSLYGQLVLGPGASSSLDDQLAKEARKAASAQKQKIAEEVASVLKVSVQLDTTPTDSSDKIVAALRAGAEYAGVSVPNCVLIAGGQSGLVGADRIGMPCVILRSSLTARAEFPSAKATMDAFGGADLTVSKLIQKRWT